LPVSDIIRRNRRETIDQVLQFPEKLGAHAMLMVFKKYTYQPPGTRNLNRVRSSTFTTQQIRGTDSILLPLPINIQDNYQVRMQRFDQGITGELVSSASAAIANRTGDITPTLSDFGEILSNALPFQDINLQEAIDSLNFNNLARATAFLVRRSLNRILPDSSRNIDVGFGNIINPKAALYFDGVEMKNHTFNWTFAPSSETESRILKDIGTIIKKNILPSYGSLGDLSRILLNYPSTLDIFFLGVDQSYFLHYKTCMVQQFNIDFTPHGIALLKGGKPAMVNMSMNVIEADIHTSEDYGGIGTSQSENNSETSQQIPDDPRTMGS
jgi:hypothetical protein